MKLFLLNGLIGTRYDLTDGYSRQRSRLFNAHVIKRVKAAL